MNLSQRKLLLTGASSGIGRATALRLAAEGCELVIAGRNQLELYDLKNELEEYGGKAHVLVADLGDPEQASNLVSAAIERAGFLDGLVNVAGVTSFSLAENQDPQELSAMVTLNLTAPMILSGALIPHLRRRGGGLIANVGSIFGSIGFPCFASYSATKFGVRGFSQALRREVADDNIRVIYVAPRATRTPLAAVFSRMASAVKMPMDAPERVARCLVHALKKERKETYIGFPEGLFVRLNNRWPGLIDGPVKSQGRKMKPYAMEAAASS